MTAPPFKILYTDTAQRVLDEMDTPANQAKMKKIRKAIKLLRDVGPGYPGLCTHKMKTLRGPNSEDVWNSYVENHTPSAWRILWIYSDPDTITVLAIGPHQ